MADFDQPESTNTPADGVDDETFARAVGLDQEQTDDRVRRKKKTEGSASARSLRGQKKKIRERPVVRRPPASEKHENENLIERSLDKEVVPLVEAPRSPVVEVPTRNQGQEISAISPETHESTLLPEEELGWLGRRRARVRRTRRTIRHIDPWSVLKVSVLLYACLYGATVIAGYLLWTAAVQSGVISNIESFVAEVGSYEIWEINGDEIFRRATVIGAVLFVAGVAFNVLLTIIFNLISDLVGGVRVTLLEEDQPPS